MPNPDSGLTGDVFIDRNILSKNDKRLRPWRTVRPRRLLPKSVQRINGSAIAAAWPWLLGWGIYGIAILLFIDFVVEDHIMEDDHVFDLGTELGIWGFFAISFFLGVMGSTASGKYGTAVSAFFDTADAIGTATIYVAGRVCKDRDLGATVMIPVYASNHVIPRAPPKHCDLIPLKLQDDPNLERASLIRIFQDIQDLLRALPFIIKHNFRTNPTTDNFSASVATDVDLGEPGVQVRLLPMSCPVMYELEHLETDAIAGNLVMIVDKWNTLVKADVVIAETAIGVDAHINNVGTQAAILNGLAVRGTIAPYSDILLAGLIIWSLFFPWELWGPFRYWSLLIYIVAITFVYGIYSLSRRIDNPFNRGSDSPYIYHDIGALTRDIAENVDDVFDKAMAEAWAFREVSGNATRQPTGDDGTDDSEFLEPIFTNGQLSLGLSDRLKPGSSDEVRRPGSTKSRRRYRQVDALLDNV